MFRGFSITRVTTEPEGNVKNVKLAVDNQCQSSLKPPYMAWALYSPFPNATSEKIQLQIFFFSTTKVFFRSFCNLIMIYKKKSERKYLSHMAKVHKRL